MTTNILLVLAAVGVLWKSADWFVEGAVGVADKLHVPKMLIGIVLVSFATTSPELITSLIATLQGYPELALGNAMGSIIVDVGVALGLAAVLSATPLLADRLIFRTSAVFVVIAITVGFFLAMDGTMSRLDGLILMAGYVGYVVVSYRQMMRSRRDAAVQAKLGEVAALEKEIAGMKTSRISALFVGGFLGVLLGSELLVRGATGIAAGLGMSPTVIGLTVVAIGTSVPEIATCVASVLKKQTQIGVGNIIGADILNICWVAGASAVANPLVADISIIWFMFPVALTLVGAMVVMLRCGYQLSRWNGAVLLALYAGYVVLLFTVVAPTGR